MAEMMNSQRLRDLQPNPFVAFHQILKKGQLGHAYLFSGNFASLDMALMLSQAIFCEQPVDSLPCQSCRSCRLIASGDFTDVKHLAPTNNIIKTDLVRSLLQDFTQSGFESDQQVFIIEGADKLHPNAANSLLKFIEEPQSAIRVFLLTDQEEAVLPTIKSRCQIFHFPKNRQFLIDELERAGLLKDQAQLIADLASDLPTALDLASSSGFLNLIALAQTWTKQYLAGDGAVYLTTAKLASQPEDKQVQGQVLDLLTLLLAKDVQLSKAQQGLDALLLAKKMWQANVNLQSALEYMVLP